ncbi:MAG: outer membrane beta-barrel protein [Thermoanaerobaculia bacterium]
MTPVNPTRISGLATLAAAIVLVGGALGASAQPAIEITPTVGFRWGGEIRAEDTTTLDRDADLEEGHSLGLVVDIPVSDHLQIELLADHQRTGLDSSTLFGPTEREFDLDIDYYHVGALYQWKTKSVTPYVVGSIGIADLDPKDSFNSGTRRFSTSFGGGVKVPLAPHLAVRFEGRGFWTDTGDTRFGDDDDDHHHCHDDDDCSSGLFQGQVRLGVTVSF